MYDLDKINYHYQNSKYIDEIPSDPFKLHTRFQQSYFDEDKLVRNQLKHQRSSSYDKDDIIFRKSYDDEDLYFDKNHDIF